MPRQNKKPVCPIGLECIEHENFQGCPNQEHCLNHTYSWAIPYTYYENNFLVVNRFPYRFRWRIEATGISHKLPPQCTLPSGSYTAIDYPHWEFEAMVQTILEEWKKAGWKAAVPIPQREDFEKLFSDNVVSFSQSQTIWIDCFKGLGFDEAVELPYEYNLEEKTLIVGYAANDEGKANGWQAGCNLWLDF